MPFKKILLQWMSDELVRRVERELFVFLEDAFGRGGAEVGFGGHGGGWVGGDGWLWCVVCLYVEGSVRGEGGPVVVEV